MSEDEDKIVNLSDYVPTEEKSRPMPQRIIRGIKEWVESLEAEYQNQLADDEHLMGHCIDNITALCRMLDEINIMEQEEADLRAKLDDAEDEDADLREAITPILKAELDAAVHKLERRVPELEKELYDLVPELRDEEESKTQTDEIWEVSHEIGRMLYRRRRNISCEDAIATLYLQMMDMATYGWGLDETAAGARLALLFSVKSKI